MVSNPILKNQLNSFMLRRLSTFDCQTSVTEILDNSSETLIKLQILPEMGKLQNKLLPFIIIVPPNFPFQVPVVFSQNEEVEGVEKLGYLKASIFSDQNWLPSYSLNVIVYVLELIVTGNKVSEELLDGLRNNGRELIRKRG